MLKRNNKIEPVDETQNESTDIVKDKENSQSLWGSILKEALDMNLDSVAPNYKERSITDAQANEIIKNIANAFTFERHKQIRFNGYHSINVKRGRLKRHS